jgi:hypothetical protein
LLAQSTLPGYGGPAVASRGLNRPGTRAGEPVNFQFFGSVMGVYDNGLTSVTLNERGEIPNFGGLYGVEANVGVYGTRQWRRKLVGLDYQGNYRHYSRRSYFDGSDHILGLDYGMQLTRRSGINFRTMAGTTSRAFGGGLGFAPADPFFVGVPYREIFDNRAYFAETSGSLIFQAGSRNFMQLGGSGFAIRRQSRALIGMNGFRTFAEFSRRVTRNQTVGVGYQYFHIDFPRVFGEADLHGLFFQYARNFGRKWQASFSAGALRSDLAGIRTVDLDPVIAELLGQTRGREAFNAINNLPTITANITRAFRRSSVFFSYNRGFNPGSGIFLIARMETVGAGFTYNNGQRWSISSSVDYGHLSGAGAFAGEFKSTGGGVTVSYRLYEGLHFSSSAFLRRMLVNHSFFRRDSSRFMVGLSYSPGTIPVWFR